MYATVFKLFGPDYLVFRLLEVLGIALVAGLFFAFAKRRVGALAALAPSVLLLFLGSAHDDTLDPLGITHVYCVAAGLGALLALERDSRRADLAACALLVVSVATFSYGFAFLGGVTVSVLLRGDRWRRAWIVLVPLALYGAWLLAPNLPDTGAAESVHLRLSNVLLIPNFLADAAAAVAAGLAGLSYDFANPSSAGIGVGTINSSWGYLIAGLAAAALGIRLRRGSVPASLWPGWRSCSPSGSPSPWSKGMIATLTSTATSTAPRCPCYSLPPKPSVESGSRDARSPFRRHRVRARHEHCPASSGRQRTLVLRGKLPFHPHRDRTSTVGSSRLPSAPSSGLVGTPTGGRRRNGSFAFSLPELRSQPESVRERADSTLASVLRLGVAAAPAPRAGQKCLRLGSHPAPPEVALRPRGYCFAPHPGVW